MRSPSLADDRLLGRFTDILRQQRKRDWLREHGKTPNRRLLFIGPPGSGKTMSAEAVAGELHLPLFIIRLEGMITRYMGETAAKLRLIFDETAKRRGVYLFDEFDAVGGQRTATNDVAECVIDVHMGRLRRKVDGSNDAPMIRNVRGKGFVLSATPSLAKNLPGLRRFDQNAGSNKFGLQQILTTSNVPRSGFDATSPHKVDTMKNVGVARRGFQVRSNG